MKRTISALAAFILILFIAACSADSYTVVYYESADRRDAALSFSMHAVPGADRATAWGAADERLGETVYDVTVPDSGRTLTFRMAKADYAEKFSQSSGTPGISGISAGTPEKTEKIGSSDVTYYVSGSTALAVWEKDGYAFSAALTLTDEGVTATADDVYPYVLAVIST